MDRTKPVAAVLAMSLALPAWGQQGEEVLVPEQDAEELRGDWVIGASVLTPGNELIGSIEDLIIDEEEGTVSAAVVSVGGFLGFGAKSIAVDWNELQIDYDANLVQLDIDREEAEAADEYVFRERESVPRPEPADGGTGTGTGVGTGTGTGNGTGTGVGTGTGTGTGGTGTGGLD